MKVQPDLYNENAELIADLKRMKQVGGWHILTGVIGTSATCIRTSNAKMPGSEYPACPLVSIGKPTCSRVRNDRLIMLASDKKVDELRQLSKDYFDAIAIREEMETWLDR